MERARSQDTSTEAERILPTHFSSLSASRALRVAAAASVLAVFCDRFITGLDETLGSGFAVFRFEGGFDVGLDGLLDFSCVAASGGGGLAYTAVNDRVFLVVERVTTGMVSLIAEGLCAMTSGEKGINKCGKGKRDGGGQGAREIDNERLQYVGFRSTCLWSASSLVFSFTLAVACVSRNFRLRYDPCFG